MGGSQLDTESRIGKLVSAANPKRGPANATSGVSAANPKRGPFNGLLIFTNCVSLRENGPQYQDNLAESRSESDRRFVLFFVGRARVSQIPGQFCYFNIITETAAFR